MTWNEVTDDDLALTAIHKLQPNPLVHPIGIGTMVTPSPLALIIKEAIELNLHGSSYNRKILIEDYKLRIADITDFRRQRRLEEVASETKAAKAMVIYLSTRQDLAVETT